MTKYLPPKNPVETYPDEGPPPRTSVTIHPDLQLSTFFGEKSFEWTNYTSDCNFNRVNHEENSK